MNFRRGLSGITTRSSTRREMAAPPVQPVVYINTRKEVRKFYGDGDGRLATEFGEEVRRVWRSQPHLSEEEKKDVIHSNIGPTVKAELRCLDVNGEKSAEETLSLILKAFGESRSTRELQLELFRTEQRAGETVQLYSHRVQDAFGTLKQRQKTLKEQVAEDAVLMAQFVAGLADPVLKRLLKTKEHADFGTLRKAAMELEEDTPPPLTVYRQDAPPSHPASALAPAAQYAPPPHPASVPAPTPQSTSSDRLDRLEALMENLMTQYMNFREQGRRDKGYDSQGRRICYHCQQPGHIRPHCPKLKGNERPPRS